jgi:hypothetical protein
MGDHPTRSVLFDPLSVQALFAQCEALQAQSVRLAAKALVLAARLDNLTALSATHIAAYPAFSINSDFK